MGRLIRLDRSGHTTLAEWAAGDATASERAAEACWRVRAMTRAMPQPATPPPTTPAISATVVLMSMPAILHGGTDKAGEVGLERRAASSVTTVVG